MKWTEKYVHASPHLFICVLLLTCILPVLGHGPKKNVAMQRNSVKLNTAEETDEYDMYSQERHTIPALFQDQGKIFGTLEDRIESFQGLPVSFRGKIPAVSDLAANGLYYTGQDDICKCYECHASFRKWVKDDNIFILHSSNHPTCAHVKQMIQSKLGKCTHN